MSSTRIATRYAKSLLDLAVELQVSDQVYSDMEYFAAVSGVRDFALMLKSPIIKADVKSRIFDEVFSGRFNDASMKFSRLILRKGREMYLADIAAAFIAQYKVKNNIATVLLTTAVPVSDGVVADISDRVKSTLLEGKEIDLITQVDEDIIGGFKIEIEDKLYDASVAHKLDRIKREMMRARMSRA